MHPVTPRLDALTLLVAPTLAAAEPAPAREALKRACTGDYLAHCSMHPPGGPEVEACFKLKIRMLSPDCASAITAYKREQKAAKRLTQAR